MEWNDANKEMCAYESPVKIHFTANLISFVNRDVSQFVYVKLKKKKANKI